MLQIGMKAPDFKLLDKEGKEYTLNSFTNKKIVLYFYPKDNTPGCTLEALNYKDNYQAFLDNGYEVIGISKDSIKSHQKFACKYELPFILLSDESLEAIKAYDVWHEKKLYGKPYMGVVRTTYVIDENKQIIYADDKVNAKTDAQKVIDTLINK